MNYYINRNGRLYIIIIILYYYYMIIIVIAFHIII